MTQRRRPGHERAFRALLRTYPAWFRDRYGQEMTHLFLARLGRCRSRGDRVRLWGRTVADAGATAVALARDERRGGGVGMETLWQDIRYTARHLGRSPVFTLGAVALLAVGIGANTTVFTVVDGLLFRPPPWESPEEVVRVYQDSDDGEPNSSSFPATRDMTRSDVFRAVAATSPSSAAWEGPDGPTPVSTEFTTSPYMEVMGLSVQRGRWFDAEHDVVGSAPVAVVSAPAWHARFGSDPGVVGRTIRLNGQPVTIIGVGPEGVSSTWNPMVTDFWLSISATPVGGDFQVANLERREDHWYEVLARLAPGVTVQQAQAAMDALARGLAEQYPEFNQGRDITVFPSEDVRVHPRGDGNLRLAGFMLSGVVLTVLLLACANLANLLLVRGLSRSGEMAVRSALGAPRSRVARLFLIESFLLSLFGGLAGLALAGWAVAMLPSLPVPAPDGFSVDFLMDARIWLFAAGLMLLTGTLFGLAPAARSARVDVATSLRDDRRGSSGGRGSLRLRNALVVVQVAASLVLVLGTGLLTRSLVALQGVDPGVDAERIAFLRTDWGQAGMEGGEIGVAMEELTEGLNGLPGVEAAALVSRLPAQQGASTTTEVEGYTPPAGTAAVELPFAIVGEGYFQTMGIPLVEGRLFNEDDVPGGAGRSIIINQAAARRFWGGVDPVGRRMRGQGAEEWSRTVVGVVGDAPVERIGEPPQPMFYFSHRQIAFPPGYVVVRSAGDPGAILGAMRQEVARVRASLPVREQGTLVAHFGESLGASRLATGMMGGFSLLALVLAGLGIYAVVSFSVARRTAEMGIRLALGAARGGVVRMVVGEVVGVVAVGLALGLLISGLGASRLDGVLYGVPGLDPVSFIGAVVLLVAVAVVAALVPARRAAAADPVSSLRTS